MKPQLLKISLNPEHSFSARHDVVPVFYNKWHYHKEVELVCFVKGTGTQFIGYDIKHFKAGDMVLVGPNLPHMWGSDENHPSKKNKAGCESYVIHFLPDCFGQDFFNLPENKSLVSLLDKAQRGLSIKGKTKESVLILMQELLNSNSTERIILLLQILNKIATSKDQLFICSKVYDTNFSEQDRDRLNDIYQYSMTNFSKPLKLEEIARVANLAPNSFCRYFKSRTRKPFSKFLIELRINHARKLLAETQKTVAEICSDCGYNSFSNFNKHFRLITNKTPLVHRKYYQEKSEG
ncbi:MAG: AraC family transcriptional regulator [Chitinophagaceae bacterium]